jgi:hypothetical protein
MLFRPSLIDTRARHSAVAVLSVLALMMLARPSFAQMTPSAAPPAEADDADTEAPDDGDVTDTDIMKGVDVSKLDWSQLNVDASTHNDRPTPKTRSNGAGAPSSEMTWSGSDRSNGASSVSVKQAVSPFLDTRIGADMTVVREQPKTMSELLADKVSNGGTEPQSSGTAWAAITAPGAGALWDQTAVEARVDPNQEQSRLGTSLSKTVPLNEQYSLALRNGYNVTQRGIVPVPGLVARPTRSHETEQSAKLSVFDTGTSVIVGQSLSSSDDKWLRKVGAEQKLFDGVNVSGAIGETAQGTTSKSITAGFKRSW